MQVSFAISADYDYLIGKDSHVPPEVVADKIERGEIIVLRDGERPLGWLRYGYFWDEIPFMNMLYVEDAFRNRGLGTRLIRFWEDEMGRRGYSLLMTSTQSDERAQHLYRRLGYKDCGALLLPDEPLEILLLKVLR